METKTTSQSPDHKNGDWYFESWPHAFTLYSSEEKIGAPNLDIS